METLDTGIQTKPSAATQASSTWEPVRVGVIGCGVISAAYLRFMAKFPRLRVVACADLIVARAEDRAREFSVPRACGPDELLNDPSVELVLNLTIPQAHMEVSLAALEAGKHVYSEKPLALDRSDARRLLDTARAKSLRIGCAPDTFLGGGLQTTRKLVDDGWIGAPVAGTACMLSHGPEHWHPDPAFLYQEGAGPLYDIGPYYLTALVSLLGPVQAVISANKVTYRQRTITSEPRYGAVFDVNTPTHVAGILEFASGALVTLVTSFDVWNTSTPRLLELYGTQGSLRAPDPNTFAGPVEVSRAGAETWSEIPLTHGYTENSRGLGVADMAYAIRSGRAHRTDAALAFHVLDIMQSLIESAEAGQRVTLASACERPAPLPLGLLANTLDA
ncbi:MAG TPA: Gfo/Idh/MocA family oxidoreductase [Ktedonobacterales bacterium]